MSSFVIPMIPCRWDVICLLKSHVRLIVLCYMLYCYFAVATVCNEHKANPDLELNCTRGSTAATAVWLAMVVLSTLN